MYEANEPVSFKRCAQSDLRDDSCFMLEVFRKTTGEYPAALSHLEQQGVVMEADLFNSRGFTYELDEANHSFVIKSVSNWHPEGEKVYFPERLSRT